MARARGTDRRTRPRLHAVRLRSRRLGPAETREVRSVVRNCRPAPARYADADPETRSANCFPALPATGSAGWRRRATAGASPVWRFRRSPAPRTGRASQSSNTAPSGPSSWKAGRLAGIVTERGRVRCGGAVLAGGAWSGPFADNAGFGLPQLLVRATVMRTGPAAHVIRPNVSLGGLALRRRDDGGYTVATGLVDHFIGPPSFRHAWRFRRLLKQSARELRLLPAAPRDYPGAWGAARRWTGGEEIAVRAGSRARPRAVACRRPAHPGRGCRSRFPRSPTPAWPGPGPA